MTCIVGIIDKNGKVTIGGDSAAVNNLHVELRKDVKVFKNKKFIIGCTSSFRMMQLLRFSLKPPARKGKDIYEYMCTDFISAIRKCFKEGGYLQTEEEGGADKGGTFLVGYNGSLFKIEGDFQVGENMAEYYAAGSGELYALGSLFTTKNSDMTVKERITIALEAAVDNNGGVKPPFVFESI